MLYSVEAEEIEQIPNGIRFKVGPIKMEAETSHLDGSTMSETATIWLALEVEESGPVLVAFKHKEHKSLYHVLRKIKGVGRRTALAVLDAGLWQDALRATSAKEVAYFAQVPGLGAAKATRVIEGLQKAYGGRLPKPLPVSVLDWIAARQRLIHLGMDTDEAEHKIYTALEKTGQFPKEAMPEMN